MTPESRSSAAQRKIDQEAERKEQAESARLDALDRAAWEELTREKRFTPGRWCWHFWRKTKRKRDWNGKHQIRCISCGIRYMRTLSDRQSWWRHADGSIRDGRIDTRPDDYFGPKK